jgi:hypothetical protein
VSRLARLAIASGIFALALRARAARADDARACIDASVAGQEQRDQGKYRAGRGSFVACAAASCPAPVRRDCSQWLAQIDELMPSILVAATDSTGRDLDEVTVTLDGERLQSRLDGMPKPVDPGPHALRFVAAGLPPVEQSIVVRVGEKARLIQVRFTPRPDARPAPTVTRSGAPSPTLGWVFGGVAAAAFLSEAYFGVAGIEQRNRDTAPTGCAPTCNSSEKSEVQKKFLVADISLGVGVVAAATSIYFFVRAFGARDGRRPAMLFEPARDGRGAAALWRF